MHRARALWRERFSACATQVIAICCNVYESDVARKARVGSSVCHVTLSHYQGDGGRVRNKRATAMSSTSSEEVSSAWDEILSQSANELISARLAMYAGEPISELLTAVRRLRQYVEQTTDQRQASVVVELVAASILSPLLQEHFRQRDASALTAELLRTLGTRVVLPSCVEMPCHFPLFISMRQLGMVNCSGFGSRPCRHHVSDVRAGHISCAHDHAVVPSSD